MSPTCTRCQSPRLVTVGAKCDDRCGIDQLGPPYNDHNGYVPKDLGIGQGDYINFSYCLGCGQIQGMFPLKPTELETYVAADEDDEPITEVNDITQIQYLGGRHRLP